jgi:uncharacterized membrane protein
MISPADKQRIADTIRVAEAKTSGEIFCVIAQRAGDYPLVPVAAAAAAALAVPAPLIYLTLWPAAIIPACQATDACAQVEYRPLLLSQATISNVAAAAPAWGSQSTRCCSRDGP